jgi:hypothetical protein
MENYFKYNKECPKCKNQFVPGKIIRLIRNSINEFQLLCPYKCNSTIKYENIISHLGECTNFDKNYLCRLCDEKIVAVTKTDLKLKNHLDICPKRKIKCQYCGNGFLSSRLSLHEQSCENKPINCDKCRSVYFKEFEKVHSNYYCMLIQMVIDEIQN